MIEFIFISVIVGLKCSGPMGLGPICYDLLWLCYYLLYLPSVYLASGTTTRHAISFPCSSMWNSDIRD